MHVLPGLALGFVAMAVVVSHTLACSDTKIFLAPCTVKASGTRITKEQAVDVQLEFVKRDGLMAIANAAIEYFDFDLAVFEGICEVGITGACRVLDCACGEVRRDDGGGSGARVTCYSFPEKSKCYVDDTAPVAPGGTPPGRLTGETVVAFCFGNSCKGFSFIHRGIAQERRDLCNESAATIGFCPDDSPDDSPEPPCDAEILTNCCSDPSRSICLCNTCNSRIWRRTKSSGKLAFTDRRGRSTCICTDEG